jgi:carboxyl-terminal processing protease
VLKPIRWLDMEKTTKPKKPDARRLIIVGLFVLVFSLGWILGHQDARFGGVGVGRSLVGKGSLNQVADFAAFWKAWDLLVNNFDGKVDYQKMIDGAITGMTNSLGDPYTTFLNKEDAKSLSDDLSGTISGIGAEVGIKNNKVTIVAPIDGSPAKKAGLMTNDIILKIDDQSTQGMSINEAVTKIRGEASTKVNLQIQRGENVKVYTITREKFTIKNIKSEVKAGNVGYVSVGRFDENTAKELRAVLEDFKSKGITKVILDLRDNPGGYLDQAVEVASEFQDKGVIVSEKKTSRGGEKTNLKATGNGVFTDPSFKIVVLTNGGSASASEIVAGALQDYKRATLIGEKTFGKGSVQEIKNLANGSQLKITVAHWFTPLGRNITKEGIAPDVKVELTDSDYNANKDPQLDRAIEFLNK